MWRWPVVQKQKELSAQARGKAFAIHGKLIAIAAARWADPSENAALAEAIYKAKKENVPNENIDRAIKRGSGQEKGALVIEEVLYEGYGAGWVAIIAKALTDNRNRTAPSIRHAFSKCSATLWESGSVSGFAFRFVGIIEIAGPLTDELEEKIIDFGAQDYSVRDSNIEIETEWTDFARIRTELLAAGYTILNSGGEYIPTNQVVLSEFDKALKVHTLIETLEEDEDVETVWHNAKIENDILSQIRAHLDAHRFRT